MFRLVYSGLIRQSLIVIAALMGLGCAGVTQSIKPPRVNITDLRIEDVKPLETAFQVELRIVNPNDFPLTVKGIECDLELNDQKFGSGVSGHTTTIPAFGTDVVSILIYSSMINLVRGILKLPEREQLSYRIKGSLRVATSSSFATSVPFENKGALDLKDPGRSFQNTALPP
jgi:LEA14-like dessication related protein